MPELSVVRVFAGPEGEGGNPLGVFLDGAGLSAERRQEVAADLGFPETVFVEDATRGALRIHTPTTELPFAGHPLLGASWLLHRSGSAPGVLRPPAGEVPTWLSEERTWVRARPEWSPPFELRQLPSAADVEEHAGAQSADELLYVWAWKDEAGGSIRARSFPRRIGAEEDEATGSAALLLAQALERELAIEQGVGSEILVRPESDGTGSVGGRCRLVEVYAYPATPRASE